MLLVVDFSDFNMEVSQTDVLLEVSPDFTVGKLLMKLSEGVESLTGEKIPDKHLLSLRSYSGHIWDAAKKVRELSLEDWDVVYITRRR